MAPRLYPILLYPGSRIRNVIIRLNIASQVLATSNNPGKPMHLALEQHHVEGARLYGDRKDMVRALRASEHGVIAEIGVALGDFSDFLIKELRPTKFIAFDIFTMHESPVIWGRPSSELFTGLTQMQFFQKRFASHGDQVALEIGSSQQTLARYPDTYFDMIYIDAAHDYESVRADAALASQKIKPTGTIIFNDYIMHDHVTGSPYGVVQAVNESINNNPWRVVGMSLQRDMFCDLAIQKMPG